MRQPTPFGKYLLLERINVGGMAEIFLTRSRGVKGFKRILAIKKILPTMAEDEEFIAMFIDEARIAAELSHAGIVQIFELGKFEDDFYIAMEFVHGKDLRFIQERLVRENRNIDIHLAAHVAFKICEALDYAHTKRDPTGRPLGIIHRDISPQNVILSFDGEVKICDFGIAKAANRSQKTQAGVLKGKFGYMSPEQVRGLPLDGRSDIFTVGTLLYELITLERLFLGESDFSTLEKVRNADVVPPSSYNRDVYEDLEEIILRALSKEVEDRYQGAAEMADALQLFMINNKHATSRDVSIFMKETFRSEFEAELRRLEEYQEMPEPLSAPSSAGEEPAGDDADPDAKTMIFASSEEGVVVRTTPPPLPSRKKADAKTAIFNESQKPDLAGAETAIFADPQARPEEDIHELPTALPRPHTDLDKLYKLEKATEKDRSRLAVPREKSLPEKLFFPLTVLVALLLGYSVLTTIRLSAQQGVEAGPPPPPPPRVGEPKPAEPKPKPAEPKPAEPKPAEPKPKPAEPKPAEPKPAKPKPAKPKPAKPKPAKPKPKPPKPPMPAKKEYGYLLANTRPWSKVYVDGKFTGRETPIPLDKKVKLTVGKHKVTFEIPSGKRFDFSVDIVPNETLKLIKRLE